MDCIVSQCIIRYMVALTVEISSARLVSGVSQLEHVYIRAPPGCSMNVLPILSLIKCH